MSFFMLLDMYKVVEINNTKGEEESEKADT
jgi:hypothetical protein